MTRKVVAVANSTTTANGLDDLTLANGGHSYSSKSDQTAAAASEDHSVHPQDNEQQQANEAVLETTNLTDEDSNPDLPENDLGLDMPHGEISNGFHKPVTPGVMMSSNGGRHIGTAASTASSVVSVSNLHFLPLKTQLTLKSPLEGHNLGPFHKPEEFLRRTLDNLASEDWETNVNGMAAVLRFARHHPDYLMVEYKPLLQYVMKHVKNLRSQVSLEVG